jgi:hypothetical protein
MAVRFIEHIILKRLVKGLINTLNGCCYHAAIQCIPQSIFHRVHVTVVLWVVLMTHQSIDIQQVPDI